MATKKDEEERIGPSNFSLPADTKKTDDGYVYPESGSFVVAAHKGPQAEPAKAEPQQQRHHPAGRRRS